MLLKPLRLQHFAHLKNEVPIRDRPLRLPQNQLNRIAESAVRVRCIPRWSRVRRGLTGLTPAQQDPAIGRPSSSPFRLRSVLARALRRGEITRRLLLVLAIELRLQKLRGERRDGSHNSALASALHLLEDHIRERLDGRTGGVAEHVEERGADVADADLVACALTQKLRQHVDGNLFRSNSGASAVASAIATSL